LDDLTFADGNLLNKTYVVRTNTAGRNITGRPNDDNKSPFILEVELIKWNNEVDYITKQTYYEADSYSTYVRCCTAGVWDSWTASDADKYDAAGVNLGLVKSGGDVTIGAGIITIKDDTVTDNKIVSVSGDKIIGGIIDADKTNIINIDASNITSGTIGSNLIADGAIDLDKLSSGVSGAIDEANNNATQAVNKANQAESTANAAQMTAEGKNTVYYQMTAPQNAKANDIWFNTGADNQMSVYDGTKWVVEQFGAGAIGNEAINADKIASEVNTKLDTAFENAENALGDALDALDSANSANNKIADWCYDNDVTYINGGRIYTGTVTAEQIAANTITANEIASKTITANEIMAGTITAESGILAEACIKEAYIQDAAITNAKIAEAAIGEANIQDAAITTAKIAELAVTNANIADATIEDAKIKNLNAAKITAGYIDAARIQAGSLSITQFDQDVQTKMANTEKDAKEALGTATTASEKATSIEADLSGFKSTVSETYTTKETLKDYSTTEQMNSAINQKAGEINLAVEGTVAKTYDKVTSKGEQLIVNGNGMLGDNTNFSTWTFDGAQTNNSSGSFTMPSGTRLEPRTDEFFLINPNCEYTLSLDIKSLNGLSIFYAFVDFYDVDKKLISAGHHIYYKGSTTTLAKELKQGDTVIYLTDSSGWNTSFSYGFYMIVWNYVNSFGYTYPAETYSRNRITLPQSGNYLNRANINKTTHTISLNSAYSGETIPVGTQVSQGGDGATYKYLVSNKVIPAEWITCGGKIKGLDYSGGNISTMFPPGTGYAKVGFLWNYNGAADQLWMTNVTLTDTTETGELNKSLKELGERVSSAELKITDDAIVSTVRSSTEYTNDLGEKVSSDEIISTINQTPESVTINASKINLQGAVTFSTFSNDLQSQINSIETTSNNSIKNVETKFALGDSTTTAPTSGWTYPAPAWQEGKYMWQKTITYYSDNRTPEETTPTCIAGATGQAGADGTGLKKINTHMRNFSTAYWQNYGTAGHEESWTTGSDYDNTHIKVGDTAYIVGTVSDAKDSNGNLIQAAIYGTVISNSTASVYMRTTYLNMGAVGSQGSTGISVSSVVPEYYLSTSNTTQSGGSWKETQDPYASGKYYWTRSKVSWSVGNPTYTTPVLATGLNNANSTASTANSTANTANSTANTAKNTADTAKSTADTALSTANTAKATADSADLVLANWCYNNNKTHIDGGKIYTGTISAEKINVADLFAQDITATGTITGAKLKASTISGSSFISEIGTSGSGNYLKLLAESGKIALTEEAGTITSTMEISGNRIYTRYRDSASSAVYSLEVLPSWIEFGGGGSLFFRADNTGVTCSNLKISGTAKIGDVNVATVNDLSSYIPLSGGSLNNAATLKFTQYGNRHLTISGNSIDADMSNDTGGWAGNFATVKYGNGSTTMLGWLGDGANLTHIFMGGVYNDPFLKFVPDGTFTFKKTPYVGSTAVSLSNHTHNYLPLSGGDMSGHIYLTGAQANSSTGNTSQLVFGTSSSNHVAISSNNNALVINPTTSSTTNQIVLYLDQASVFPNGISGNLSGNATSATKATQDGDGNVISSTYSKTSHTHSSLSSSSVVSLDNTVTFTSSTSLAQVTTITVPANCVYYVNVIAQYENSKPTYLKIKNNSTGVNVVDTSVGSGHATGSFGGYTTQSYTFAVSAQYASAASNKLIVYGYYIKVA
jgi:hypothetical protein